MPKGTSIFIDIFSKAFEKDIPNLFLKIIVDKEWPIPFRTLMAILEMCKPCAEYIGPINFDAQSEWLISF